MKILLLFLIILTCVSTDIPQVNIEWKVRPCITYEDVTLTYYGVIVIKLPNGQCVFY